MKKLITFFTFTAVVLGNVLAQNGSDPEAKKILDAVSAKFKTFKTVQAKFTLKVENASGQAISSKTGTIYMKGSKYRISVTGQEIFCDGSNVSTYEKAAKELTITKIDPSANTITPQKLFTNFYDKDFLYKLNGEKKVGNKTIQEIELTPVDKTKPFFKVLLYVDKASNTITSSKLFEKSGNRFTYTLGNMATNGAISDAQFVFDEKQYPGTEIIDLR
jgi:outer membrane lipoprotein carrier protein